MFATVYYNTFFIEKSGLTCLPKKRSVDHAKLLTSIGHAFDETADPDSDS